MKKFDVALLASIAVAFVFCANVPVQADCGKMMVVYYVWPSPPPPPPAPVFMCPNQFRQPAPRVPSNVGLASNSTYQNAGRDAINVVRQITNNNNGNLVINEIQRPDSFGRSQIPNFNPTSTGGFVDRSMTNNAVGNNSTIGNTTTDNSVTDNSVMDNSATNSTTEWEQWIQDNSSNADTTSISYGPDDSFFEEEQQGIIAWNGKTDQNGEELLILSTNEQSTSGQATAMLSVLPLPGEPISIDRANVQAFVEAKALYAKKSKSTDDVSGYGVVMEKKIGSHNIFVWEVTSSKDFQGKVQSYIAEKYGSKAAVLITSEALKVVKQYCDKGFRYFAFDLTLVEGEKTTKEAIAYRFKSKNVYFPLTISKIGGTDDTMVDLFVFTPNKIKLTSKSVTDEKFSKNPDYMTGGTALFTSEDFKRIDPSLANFFDGASAMGREFVFSDKIDGFDDDFTATNAN